MPTETLQHQDAIVERIKHRREVPLDFQAEALVGFLDYEHAKEFLKEDVTPEGWTEAADEYSREGVLKAMQAYWEFAVEKATGHRGISASRSVEKYQAWTWLLREDSEIDWDNYANYGAPILKQIGERYNFAVPEVDQESFERMAQGLPCRDDCLDGCS